MKYNITVNFKDHSEVFKDADGYSHASCVLAIFYYSGLNQTVKLFPLADIVSIDIVQIGA